MQQLVDHVVIINKGRLVRQGPLAEVSDWHGVVSVRTPQADQLVAALTRVTAIGSPRVQRTGRDSLQVTGIAPARIGHVALAERIELHELTANRSGLEEAFFALTSQGAHELAAAPEEVR
jgi:ABC-2 type transport system ATP-binding protein